MYITLEVFLKYIKNTHACMHTHTFIYNKKNSKNNSSIITSK